MVAGVCGGLGRYFDVNPAFYRVGFVVLALLGGAGILDLPRGRARDPGRGPRRVDRRAALRERRDRRGGSSASRSSVAAIVLLSQRALAGRVGAGSPSCSPASRSRSHGRGRAAPARAPSSAVAGAARSRCDCRARPARDRRRHPRSARRRWRRRPVGDRARGRRGAVGVASSSARSSTCVGGLVVIGLLLGVAAILASTIDLSLDDGVGDRTYAPATAAGLQRRVQARRRRARSSTSAGSRCPPGQTHVEGARRRRRAAT